MATGSGRSNTAQVGLCNRTLGIRYEKKKERKEKKKERERERWLFGSPKKLKLRSISSLNSEESTALLLFLSQPFLSLLVPILFLQAKFISLVEIKQRREFTEHALHRIGEISTESVLRSEKRCQVLLVDVIINPRNSWTVHRLLLLSNSRGLRRSTHTIARHVYRSR